MALFLISLTVQPIQIEGLTLLPNVITKDNTDYIKILNATEGTISGGVLIDSSWVLTTATKTFTVGEELKAGKDVIGKIAFSWPSPFYDPARMFMGTPAYNLQLLHLQAPYVGSIKPAKRARWISAPQRMIDVVIASYNKNDQKEIGQNMTWFSAASPKRPFVMHFSPSGTEGVPPFEAMISPEDVGSGVFWRETENAPYLLIGICSLIDHNSQPQMNLYAHASFQAENLIGKSNTWIDNTIIAYAIGGEEVLKPKVIPPLPSHFVPPPPSPSETPSPSTPVPKVAVHLTAEVVDELDLLQNTGLFGSFVTDKIILTVPENASKGLEKISFNNIKEDIDFQQNLSDLTLLVSEQTYDIESTPLTKTTLTDLYNKEIYLIQQKKDVKAIVKTKEVWMLDLGKPTQILKVTLPTKSDTFNLEKLKDFSVSSKTGLSEGAGVFLKNKEGKFEICGIVIDGKIHLFTPNEKNTLDESVTFMKLRK